MKKSARSLTSLLLSAALLLALPFAAYADDTVDTILSVGTTQAFTDEPVPEADIQTILQAGLASESAINQQPWYFVAVTDQNMMAELSGSGFSGGGSMPSGFPGGEMPSGFPGGAPASMGGGSAKAALGDSPLAILVYMNENTASPNPSFDCGLAVQNIYIAAASLG